MLSSVVSSVASALVVSGISACEAVLSPQADKLNTSVKAGISAIVFLFICSPFIDCLLFLALVAQIPLL